MNALAILARMFEVFEYLQKVNLALDYQANKRELNARRRILITWESSQLEIIRERDSDVKFTEYLMALRERYYSILLFDGSLIQLTLEVEKSKLIAHRYAYIPCPVHIEESDLLAGDSELVPVEDFINQISPSSLEDRLRIRAPLRFEFDPVGAAKFHPESHLHLGKPQSRVAVSRPLDFLEFLNFIFSNFYKEKEAVYGNMPSFNFRKPRKTITDFEKDGPHMVFPA